MPELPELEVVSEVLNRKILGQTITNVEVVPPGGAIITRDLTGGNFAQTLTGHTIQTIQRRSKFLVFTLNDGLYLAVNEKLTGRLQLTPPAEKRKAKTGIVLTLSGGLELRYFDPKTMGQFYLTRDLAKVPDYAALGPEPFDITLDDFRKRIKPYRGEIKNVIINGEFIAGIGNAYADEILWAAHLNPYRKRTQLTPEEIDALYHAIQTTLHDATNKVRVEMGENIHLKPQRWKQNRGHFISTESHVCWDFRIPSGVIPLGAV